MKFSARNESSAAAAAVAHCGAKIRSGRVLHHRRFFPFAADSRPLARMCAVARNKQEPLLVAADDVHYDYDCDVLQLAAAAVAASSSSWRRWRLS